MRIRPFLGIIIVVSTLSARATKDSLKTEPLRPCLELGYSTSLNIPNSNFDNHTAITRLSRAKVGLGVFLYRGIAWEFKLMLQYQRSFVRQRMFFDGFFDLNYISLAHGLDEGMLTVGAYRNLLNSEACRVWLGAGIQPWYYFIYSHQSKTDLVTDGLNYFDSRIITYAPQKLQPGGFIGINCEYDLKKIGFGFNFELHARQSKSINYSYVVDEWFTYSGKFGVTGPYIELGSFVIF